MFSQVEGGPGGGMLSLKGAYCIVNREIKGGMVYSRMVGSRLGG